MRNAARCQAAVWVVWMLGSIGVVNGADLHIVVSTPDGKPVPEVVTTAIPTTGSPVRATHERKTAIMDQVNKTFTPQVLVIGQGTSVEFPNNDSVSHQVYSFSPAKKFQLPLYKGELHSPVQFDTPGLVVLGCNIHDSMVGYIYVADTPYFGKSDDRGSVRFSDVPRGRYRVSIWSPRIADSKTLLTREVEADGTGAVEIAFTLQQALRSTPEPRPRPEGWDAY